jgi:hypothetical protein
LARSRFQVICIVLCAGLLGVCARSQDASSKPATPKREAAIVTSARVIQDKGVPAVEIVTSHPVLPTIQMLDSPPRLVIDLANARMGLTHKRTPVLQEDMLTLRVEQFQNEPPITRIVLDLLVTYGYSWDVSGDTLTVRLKPAESAASKKPTRQPPQVLSLTPAAKPVAVPVTSGIGDVVLAGKQFAAGSTLTAEKDTAVLRLTRGGEVRVCPGTSLSISPSKTSKDLMFGMSSGALETDYSLAASADTVLTPDFRIFFAGPGEIHYAVSTDSHGTTCVRGLQGNTSSAVVSELMGDRVYQVKPTEQAVFHLGRIDKVDSNVPLECGCPPPAETMQADAGLAKPAPETGLPANTTLGQGAKASDATAQPATGDPKVLSNGPETQPLPPSQPGDVHIQVDAPFVFRGKPPGSSAPATDAAATPPASAPPAQPTPAAAQTPEQSQQPAPATDSQPKPEHRGVLRRIGRFFSSIWR